LSIEQQIEKAKRTQQKGQMVEELADTIPTQREPTLYEESAKLIVQKLFAPLDMHERQLTSNIPRQILTNIMSMQAIEHGTRAMIEGKTTELITTDGKEVVLIHDDLHPDKVKKKMTYKAYRRARMYVDFMAGFTSNLLEEMPAVDGERANQGITAIGSLTNSERMLLEAQNQSNAGLLKKIWRKVF